MHIHLKRSWFKQIFVVFFIVTSFILSVGSSVPVLAQTSVKTDLAAPRSIIINFGADPQTSCNFTWVTSGPIKSGYVEYCSLNDFSGFGKVDVISVEAQNRTVKTDIDIRTIHKVSINNLKPGTEYTYRVGTAGKYSTPGAFTTALTSPGSFTFLHITDTQGASAKDYAVWKNTLDKALAKYPKASFLVHTGDIVDTGYRTSQWDMFADTAESELMRLPILPVVGNHDALNGNKTNNFIKNFTDRFNITGTGDNDTEDTGAPAGTVYSVDYGDVHIAVMNTQCGSANYKKQAEWLRNDMKKSQKAWKLVALHRGPYGAIYDTSDIRKAWAPVFDELGIDLVLQGHDHNYMRSYPIKNGQVVGSGKGTVYLVGNTGGVKYYTGKKRSWQAVDMQPKTPMCIAVTVSGTNLKIEAYDVKDVLRDTATLVKQQPL